MTKKTVPNKKNTPVIAPAPVQTDDRSFFIVLSVVLAAAIFLPFLPVLKNGFVWFDTSYILENPYIKSLAPSNIAAIFSNFYQGNYHPLTLLSYALDHQFAGFNPMLYHLVNILLHIANTVVLFFIISKITGRMTLAIVVSVLFGLHPMQVETIAWISCRKDLLYVFFFLFSIIIYLFYQDKKSTKLYILSIILFLLSCLSKSMAVVLPLVLLLIDYFQHRKFDKNSLIEKIPYFIIALIFGIIALFARQVGSEMQIIAKFSAFERIMFASYGFLFYIFKMLVPVNLSALYPYPDKLIQSLPAIFYIAPVLAGLVGALVFIFRKVDRSIPFGFLFYLVLIFPVLQIIQTGEAITADRYFYLASVGLFFIIGFAVEKISNKYKKMPYITNMLISIIVLPVILITWNRTKVWKDEVTLMDDVILKNKNVSTAYFNLGVNYYKDKKINTALIMLNQTLRLNPDYEKAFYYIGACNNANGEFTDAVKMLKKAIQKNPANINAYAELGSVYMKLKEWENAEKYLSTALEIDKNNVEVNFNLATASMNLKKYDRAIELFKNVIGQNKSHYSAITKLGLSFYYKGEYDTALKYLETAIALQPGSNSAYAAKGLVYSDGIKDKLKAVEAYKTAAKLGDKGSQIWLLNNGENLSF